MADNRGLTGAIGWTVGELARATGLSERVLRHWELIGVVSPARTATGHRRYLPEDVTRLYRALALRQTGLRLNQIAALLDAEDPDPASTLRSHLTRLDAELRRLTVLRARLASALDAQDLAASDAPDHGRARETELLMKVIGTMTMFDQYVHGYRAEEGVRLSDQANALLDLLHADTGFPDGSAILEVGCGVGAQTVTIAKRSPGARIAAIDMSAGSLSEARRRVHGAGFRDVTFDQVDVYSLPHPSGRFEAQAFDHVFMCFVLEHLPRPVDALARLRAMVKPGGTVTVIEGDHGSTYFHPESDAARDAIACQVTLQRNAEGDALIGRRLHPLLVEAGYHDVVVSPRMVYVDGSRPDLAEGFILKTFTAMVQGIREPALAAGLIEPDRFDAGVRDLRRTAEPDGVFCYTFFSATAAV